MQVSLRDILLVVTTCFICFCATVTADYLVDRLETNNRTGQLLRRIQREKEIKDKQERDKECTKCRIA